MWIANVSNQLGWLYFKFLVPNLKLVLLVHFIRPVCSLNYMWSRIEPQDRKRRGEVSPLVFYHSAVCTFLLQWKRGTSNCFQVSKSPVVNLFLPLYLTTNNHVLPPYPLFSSQILGVHFILPLPYKSLFEILTYLCSWYTSK